MCFGIRATTPLLSWCLRRASKLLPASAMYSHLTVLDSHAGAHANTPAFKLPHMSTHGAPPPSVEAWIPVSYRRFREDVEHFARYWMTTFQRAGIKPRSCIGIWWVSTSHTHPAVRRMIPPFPFRLSFLAVADCGFSLLSPAHIIRLDGTGSMERPTKTFSTYSESHALATFPSYSTPLAARA